MGRRQQNCAKVTNLLAALVTRGADPSLNHPVDGCFELLVSVLVQYDFLLKNPGHLAGVGHRQETTDVGADEGDAELLKIDDACIVYKETSS